MLIVLVAYKVFIMPPCAHMGNFWQTQYTVLDLDWSQNDGNLLKGDFPGQMQQIHLIRWISLTCS